MKIFISILMLVLSMEASGITLPKHFKADFTNIITNTKNKVIQYNGYMHFSNISHLKWVYIKPTKKEVCTDGNALIIVDHDLEQVSHYEISKGFDFVKILKSAKLYSKNIYTSNYEGKIVTIQVDKKKKLHSIAYFDDLDNKVQIVFKNIKYSNKNASKQSLICEVPKDYDVIRG